MGKREAGFEFTILKAQTVTHDNGNNYLVKIPPINPETWWQWNIVGRAREFKFHCHLFVVLTKEYFTNVSSNVFNSTMGRKITFQYNVQSRIIHNSFKLETTQMPSTVEWIKLKVSCPRNPVNPRHIGTTGHPSCCPLQRKQSLEFQACFSWKPQKCHALSIQNMFQN